MHPDSFRSFGSAAYSSHSEQWLINWTDCKNNFSLFLILAGTRTAAVEGISAAGATSQSRRFTALADAEFLLKGPFEEKKWHLPDLPAGISPAIISYAACNLIGIKPTILPVGIDIVPPFPHLRIETPPIGPSQCLSSGKSMCLDRASSLWEQGFQLGKKLNRPLLISECVPGGTTTAQAILTGLGLSVSNLIGSSAISPPIELKKALVEKGLSAANLSKSSSPIELVAGVGDPFQPLAAGLLLGARQAGQPVLLGGGSQMIAVLALALSRLKPYLRESFVKEVAIGTTPWLFQNQRSSNGPSNKSPISKLLNLVERHFNLELFAFTGGLSFSSSTFQSLRDYELGYVKEGVGAGALSFIAQLQGATCNDLLEECEKYVSFL